MQNTHHQRLNLRLKDLNKTLAFLALPAIAENCLTSMVFFTDTLIVGWLQNEAYLAATALAGIMMFLMNAPFIGMSVAAASIVSRSWGEEDFQTARITAGQALGISVAAAAILAVIGSWYSYEIMIFFGAAPEVAAVGGKYLHILLISCIGGLPMIVSNAVIRGMGNSLKPLWITGTMNLVNIVASIILAFGLLGFPKMGFYGVAVGTVIARTVGAVLSIGFLTLRKGLFLRFMDFIPCQKRVLQRLLSLASPTMVERTVTSLSYMLFMKMVAMLGTTLLAAHNVALQIEAIVFMPTWGLAIASTTITGQAVGAKLEHIAEIAVKRLIYFAGGLMVITGILFAVFGDDIVRIFKATEPVLEAAGMALRISALELPFLAITFIFMGALRGAGDTRSPLYVSLSGTLLVRLGSVYLLAFVLDWGLAGVWLATCLDWMARAAGLGYFFNKGVWKLIHHKEKSRYSS